jgi:hypothetical protein
MGQTRVIDGLHLPVELSERIYNDLVDQRANCSPVGGRIVQEDTRADSTEFGRTPYDICKSGRNCAMPTWTG